MNAIHYPLTGQPIKSGPPPSNVPAKQPSTLSQRNKAAKQPSNVAAAKRVAMLKRERKLLESWDESLSW